MTLNARPGTRSDGDRLERELLARLGLTSQVNTQDIEAAHEALLEFLETAPHELKGWAQREVAAADEAYALLSDPTADLAAHLAAQPVTPDAKAPAGANVLVAPAAAIATAAAATADEDEDLEELHAEPPTTAKARREARHRAQAVAARVAAGQPAEAPLDARSTLLRKRLAIAVAVLVTGVAALGVIGAVYRMGASSVPGINGTPAPESSAAAQVDPAQVAALMQKITANPQDVASLQSLADLYYEVSDFKTAGTFLAKILAIDPKNVIALLALGAVDFNQGDAANAEKQWRAVLAIDARNVEAYYDLGFLYLSKSPPDVANVKLAWGKVIEIDPTSAVAKTVATHLASLDASPAPIGSGAPSASPAASPASSGN